MRPRRQVALLYTEASLLVVTSRRRFDQAHHTVLAKTVEIPVRVNERSFADAAVAPGNLTRVELHRSQNGTREAIQVIADKHGAAVMVAHLFGEVELLRLVVSLDLDHA